MCTYKILATTFVVLFGVLVYNRIRYEKYTFLKDLGEKISPAVVLPIDSEEDEKILYGDDRDFGRDGIVNGHHPTAHRKIDDINNKSSSTTV